MEVLEYDYFTGHNQATSDAFEEWAQRHIYKCHFTIMKIDKDNDGNIVFYCQHCGHTVDIDGIKIEV